MLLCHTHLYLLVFMQIHMLLCHTHLYLLVHVFMPYTCCYAIPTCIRICLCLCHTHVVMLYTPVLACVHLIQERCDPLSTAHAEKLFVKDVVVPPVPRPIIQLDRRTWWKPSLRAGRPEKSCRHWYRFSLLLGQEFLDLLCVPFDGCDHSPLNGIRLGEASHPGPQQHSGPEAQPGAQPTLVEQNLQKARSFPSRPFYI